MTVDLHLLAVRIGARDFALEPGRTYQLGSSPSCDLRIDGPGVAGVHARLEMRGGEPILAPVGAADLAVNGVAGPMTLLRVGDTVRLGPVELRIVRDLGQAELVPLPALVAARRERSRPAAVTIAARGTVAEAGSFTELMAHELRRAPWFALSLLLHVVLLLLLWWLLPVETTGLEDTRYGFAPGTGTEAAPSPRSTDLPKAEVETEAPDARSSMELEAAPIEPQDAGAPTADAPPPEPGFDAAALLGSLQQNPRITARSGGNTGNDVLDTGAGEGAGGFRETVVELRKIGLEVVFVFDSTGSMGRSIAATKANITSMLETLRALVPEARFSLVTYRDRGPREEYLVRSLPIGSDFYAAANFMHGVEAGGGGDFPEAVLAGLREAFRQTYRSGARRVVVLAGDAPPHPDEERAVLDEVRAFARDGRSFVHTLMTSGSASSRTEEVRETFRRIAERGRGIAVDVADQDRILLRVLTLAFGERFEGNVAAVQRLVAERQPPIETWALDLARSGGDRLRQMLRRPGPPPEPLVQALLRTPRREPALALVDVLAAPDTGSAGRNAASHVLRHLLDLPASPIDAVRPEPLTPAAAERLRQTIREVLPN